MRIRCELLERQRDDARNEARIHREMYVHNLNELHERETLIRNLRWRLSELGKPERQRKPTLP